MMPAPPYSDSSLGRLAFSQACRDLSDLARAHVATYADGHLRPGELLEEAARLVAGAEQALRMAVVAERLRGTSWAQIGDTLGVTRQSAHERYAAFEHEMRRALLFPDRAGGAGALGWWAVPDGLEDPERTARQLDEWDVRHRERTDPERGEAAVSAGLQPRRTLDETGAVIELGKLLLDDRLPAGVSRGRAERELYERKVAVFEHMLAEGTADATVATQLAEARARLAELTSQATS
jgi:hypothetical protein